MARRYSPEVKAFIAENVCGRTARELVDLVNAQFDLGFTESMMKSYKTNNNLKSGTPCGRVAGSATKLFPMEIKNFIEKNYKGVGYMQMVELLKGKFGVNYTVQQIKSFYGNHKLDSGITGRFEKGQIPPNKGKKGWCAPGCEKGWFKKGATPINHRPVGSERVDVDGYILIKTAEPNVWKLKHRVVWEEANGKVPEGHIVTFLDGDKSNVALDNLSLITMAESLALTRSNLRSGDPEFTKTGILIARIKVTAHKVGKAKQKKDVHMDV